MARRSVPPPTFDLESWIINYDGVLLPRRLLHIATHCPALSKQTFEQAQRATQQGKDVSFYRIIVENAASLNEPIIIDSNWIEHQDEANRRELVRLESELRGYKNNLIRESIRMGQEDLASHQLATGGPREPQSEEEKEAAHGQYGLAAAYSAYGKMRDFCTTPGHIAGMTVRQLYTAIVQAVAAQQNGYAAGGHWQAIQAHANRLRNVGVKEEEQERLTPIAFAAAGIASIGQHDYHSAATCFLNTSFELSTNGAVQGFDFCRLIASANDIAIYGGLTALATMSRAELDVFLGSAFRTFLELEPHMRKAITLFCTGKYQACLSTLQRYFSDWSLDLFLGAGIDTAYGSHVDRLINLVREKSITAYCSSFSQVSLTSLATTFPPRPHPSRTPEIVLEMELVSMIESGALQAKLDVVNGVLVSPLQDRRVAVQNAAVDTASDLERNLTQRLHKVNVALAGLEILKPKTAMNRPMEYA